MDTTIYLVTGIGIIVIVVVAYYFYRQIEFVLNATKLMRKIAEQQETTTKLLQIIIDANFSGRLDISNAPTEAIPTSKASPAPSTSEFGVATNSIPALPERTTKKPVSQPPTREFKPIEISDDEITAPTDEQMIQAFRSFEADGQMAEAKTILLKILDEYPRTHYRDFIFERLAEMASSDAPRDDEKFKVVFNGEIKEGASRERAIISIMRLYQNRYDMKKTEELFFSDTGREIVIKSDLQKDQAESYIKTLSDMSGCIFHIQPM